MTKFRYSALDSDGRFVEGVLEEADAKQVSERLAGEGKHPFNIRQARGVGIWRLGSPEGAGREEIAALLSDLAALYRAGVPLHRALHVLSGSSSKPVSVLAGLMAARLEKGTDPSSASKLFETGELSIAAELIRAGEASGQLGETLDFAARMIEARSAIARQFAGALIYPAFLIILSLIAIVSLAVFAGPALQPILDEAGSGPSGLLAFLSIGGFLRTHWFAIGCACLLAVVALASFMQTSWGSRFMSLVRTRTPIMGSLVRDLNYGNFAIALGALLSGGVSGAKAMDIAAKAAPNRVWADVFLEAAENLKEGLRVHDALARLPNTPGVLLRLAKIGEETGALGAMLDRAGSILVTKATRRLEKIASIVGPALILAIGALVGWIISSFMGGLSSLGDVGL